MSLLLRFPPLRLSVRLLMATILLLAIVLGWIVDCARIQREAVAAVRRAGGSVAYDCEVDKDGMPRTKPLPLKWLIDSLGIDYVSNVAMASFGGNADDAVLVQVGRLNHLERLGLSNNRGVTDAGLAHLKGLTRLRSLDLMGTSVKGPGLAQLHALRRLESLDLQTLPLSDADLAPLADLTALKRLLITASITDAGMVHLKPLTNLEFLALRMVPISTAGLAPLAGMTQLKTLILTETRIDSLVPIKDLTSLVDLRLVGTSIDDRGLAPVEGFRSLTSLTLSRTRVTDQGLIHLRGLSKLTELQLARTAVTEDGLKAILASLSALRSLALRGTTIAPEELSDLKRTFPSVSILP